ncbi:protein of unknown function [Rhodovastum atsumiense]|nr:protein of unknown function [Rhodovastum atsumiense]
MWGYIRRLCSARSVSAIRRPTFLGFTRASDRTTRAVGATAPFDVTRTERGTNAPPRVVGWQRSSENLPTLETDLKRSFAFSRLGHC